MESLVSILFHGAAVGVVYGLLALGFSLIYSTCKVFNIAHGAFWLVGCYGTVAALKMNAPFPISVVIGILLSAAVGVLSEVVVFAPLEFREAPPTVTLLSSLGCSIVITNILVLWFGPGRHTFYFSASPSFVLGPLRATQMEAFQLAIALLVIGLILAMLRLSGVGTQMRALRDNSLLAQLLGINLPAMRRAIFGLGAALAATSGILSATDGGFEPVSGFRAMLVAAMATILGGTDYVAGPVIAAIIVGIVESLLLYYGSSQWIDLYLFALLLALLWARPSGLMAHRKRLEEMD